MPCLRSFLCIAVLALLPFIAAGDAAPEPIGEINECPDFINATFSASPTAVPMGSTTTLSWNVTSPVPSCLASLSLTISNGVGRVSRQGSREINVQTSAASWILSASQRGLTWNLGAVTVTADNTSYTSQNTPWCSGEEIAQHEFVLNEQYAVDVLDPDGHYIGPWQGDAVNDNYERQYLPGREYIGYWVPVDGYKHTVCGTFKKHVFFSGFLNDEDDSCPHIMPRPAFDWAIDDAIALGVADPDSIKDCNGSRCMEFEATIDSSDNANPFFPRADGSVLIGGGLCAYGAWIGDDKHDGRPELHPTDARWWPEATAPGFFGLAQTRLFLMQDDSNRFDTRADYDPDMPAAYQPWSGAPRSAFIRYAFLLPEAVGQQQYLHVWNTNRQRHVTTAFMTRWADVTTSSQHTLKFDGQPRLTVVEQPPAADGNLAVSFDEDLTTRGAHDVCRRPGGLLQGYVLLRTRFGVDSDGGEGYQEILLRRTVSPTEPGMPPQPTAVAAAPSMQSAVSEGRVDARSVRLVKDGEGTRLTGDLLLTMAPAARLLDAAAGAARHPVAVSAPAQDTAGGDAATVRLAGIDLSGGTELQTRFADGRVLAKALPGIGVALTARSRHERVPATERQLQSAWDALLRETGARKTRRPEGFSYLGRWTLDALPRFSAKKNGRVSGEDTFQLADLLNRSAEHGETAPVLTLADAVQRVRWQDPASAHAPTGPLSHVATFGSAERIAARRVTVELDDVFGGSTVQTFALHSHGIGGLDERTALELVVALSGVAAARLAPPAPGDAPWLPAGSSVRGAFAQLLARSPADGLVTPEELKTLLRLARQLGRESGSRAH